MSRNPRFNQLLQELYTDIVTYGTPHYNVNPLTYNEMTEIIIDNMLKTYEAKDQDYASNGKPMGNLRGSEEFGIPAWKAVLLRMSDKKQRITSFINRKNFKVDDEKITDTLIDLANYAILGFILFEEIYPCQNETDSPQNLKNNFLNIASCAIKSKILYDLNFNADDQNSVPTNYYGLWCGENWENLITNFDKIALFAREN